MLTISPIEFPGLGLKLDPAVGFSIGPLNINFYGVCIAVGLLLAVLYGCLRSKEFGFKQDDILDGVLIVVPIAVVFARLYYCVFEWDMYKADPISVLYIWKGGLAIYGGVIGAVLGVTLFCLLKKIKLPALLDLVALGFLIGQCIGRWGNFFNREAYGAETTGFLRMGLLLTADRVPTTEMHFYHPTFLYESLWNLCGFVLLHFLSKRRKYDGQIALGYAAWYGLGRALIEGLRTDSLYIPGSDTLRVSQLLAALTCFAAVVVLVVFSFKRHDKAKLYGNVMAKRWEEEAAKAAKAAEEAPEITENKPSLKEKFTALLQKLKKEKSEETEETEEAEESEDE